MTQDSHMHNHDHEHNHDHGHEHSAHTGHDHHNQDHNHDHDYDHGGHGGHSHDDHNHDHDHEHGAHAGHNPYEYEHEHDHNHGGHNHDHNNHNNSVHNHSHGSADKKHVRLKVKNIPGLIRIERNIHDEAIVISGELTVNTTADDVNAVVASELENASGEITKLDGIVGHIKASVSIITTGMISVTEDKAMIKEGRGSRVRISIAAIVFLVEPERAEETVRKALLGIRKQLSS